MEPPANDQGSDRELVGRCLNGDRTAIRELVERFQYPVFGLCLRMVRHRHDAEDLAQETMLRMVRALGNWDSSKDFKPWVLAIAANRCRTHLSQSGKRPTASEMVLDLPEETEEKSDVDLADELDRALQMLRPHYRLVVVMYHEQDLAYDEISAALGKPVGTVKTWLHRARLELAELLSRRGYGQPASSSLPTQRGG